MNTREGRGGVLLVVLVVMVVVVVVDFPTSPTQGRRCRILGRGES